MALTSLLTFGALATVATPSTGDYLALAALLALLVGVIRMAIGLARSGVVVYLMSRPVLAGFTPGAAVVIAASQFPATLRVDPPDASVLAAAVRATADVGAWEPAAIAVGAATIAVVLGARRLSPLVPGVLVAVGGSLAYSHLADYGGAVVGALPDVVPSLSLALPWSEAPSLLLPAAVIAVIGFAEAGAISRTFAEQTRRRWDADREFVSQGVAKSPLARSGDSPQAARSRGAR